MNKVAIYCRLSDEDRNKRNAEDESESIQNQKSMLVSYAMAQGWDIYEIYCDEDYSGADKNRPRWRKMIDEAENRKFEIILCKTQSRFSRDMEMVERYIHGKFNEWGIRFISLIDHADTEIEGNKKARQINGLINEWYLEDLSYNIRRTLNHKKHNGEFCGSFAPYGYSKDPENKNKLIIDPEAAEVVKEIFNLFVSGVGYQRIAKTLNERGIRNPTRYKRENGSKYANNENRKRITNNAWTQDTIYRILRKQEYIGALVQGKTSHTSYKNKKRIRHDPADWIIYENAHEPIIEMEVWNKTQEILSNRTRPSSTTGIKHIFSGKLFCATCENTFYKTRYNVKAGTKYYFRCRTPFVAPDLCCNRKAMPEDKLNEIILNEINTLLEKHYNADLINIDTTAEADNERRKKGLETERRKVMKEFEQKEKMIESLYGDKVAGIITPMQFVKFNMNFEKEIAELNAIIKRLDQDIGKIEAKKDKKHERARVLNKYKKIEELTRELVDEFIEKVIVSPYNKEKKTRPLEIVWRF